MGGGVSATDPASHLLLLDLDGVVVFEHGPPWLERLEILRLHDGLAERLAGLGAPVVVLTHRSRAEAARVLEAAEVGREGLAGVMAAEDLALAGVRHGALARLVAGGLKKSLILPEVEARLGVPRARMALIDDRMDNLEDLLAHGLGLALRAPSAVGGDGGLVSFDFAEAAAEFDRWRREGGPARLHALAPVTMAPEAFRRTGLCTTAQSGHAFNRMRTAARRVRHAIRDAVRR